MTTYVFRFNNVFETFSGKSCQRQKTQATSRAFERFAKKYPEWVDALFDEMFVTDYAKKKLKQGKGLNINCITQAWADQMHYRNATMRQRHIEQVKPVALDFLTMLRQEMSR